MVSSNMPDRAGHIADLTHRRIYSPACSYPAMSKRYNVLAWTQKAGKQQHKDSTRRATSYVKILDCGLEAHPHRPMA